MIEKDSLKLLALDDPDMQSTIKALSSKNGHKILSFLEDKEFATATIIAKNLEMPLSSVTHILKLMKAQDIVTDKEYHYSEKGNVVSHYSLSNKIIIIAPSKKRESLLSSLQGFIPGLLALAGLGIVSYASKLWMTMKDAASIVRHAPAMMKSMAKPEVMYNMSAQVVDDAVVGSAQVANNVLMDNVIVVENYAMVDSGATCKTGFNGLSVCYQEPSFWQSIDYSSLLLGIAIGVTVLLLGAIIRRLWSNRRNRKND